MGDGRSRSSRGHIIEVWAQLVLADADHIRVRKFFLNEIGIEPRFLIGRMHLTVYHARRPMPGLSPTVEAALVQLPAVDTRFMVMAPGGENPRPNLEPGERKVGIRVHKQSPAMAALQSYRERLLQYETTEVLGRRAPSTHRANAFGARNFQPHMTLLQAGSGIDRDLTPLGNRFREMLGTLTFDRFEIEIARK